MKIGPASTSVIYYLPDLLQLSLSGFKGHPVQHISAPGLPFCQNYFPKIANTGHRYKRYFFT